MATGWPMKTTYADGDVYSAQDVNDITGTINLLGQSVTTSAGKNAIINGGMDVWQRGTSISVAASTRQYSSDRWQAFTNANQASTYSRQATSDTTNLATIQYCARVQRNSGQTGTTDGLGIFTCLETSDSIRYAGKTVTLSFYARKGANYSATSNALTARLYTGTGTDQNVLTGYTGQADTSNTATLTATWTRYTYAIAIPATATEISVGFYYAPTGTASTNDYFEVTGVQLELGTATTFARTGGTIQGELAACQRYYYRAADSSSAFGFMGIGMAASTTSAAIFTPFPVQMRTKPTSIDFSTVVLSDSTGTNAVSALVIDSNVSAIGAGATVATSTGLTTVRPYYLRQNGSGAGYLAFSAEL
jgi:hypothetical protein